MVQNAKPSPMLLAALLDPIREFFTLRSAERAVLGHLPAQHERARLLSRAAAARVRAGRRTLEAVAASVLLREGVFLYLRAAEASCAAPSDAEMTPEELVVRFLPPVPPEPASPVAPGEDDSRARLALTATDPLYLDLLPPGELERTRWALDRVAGRARSRVEVRSRLHLRALRWSRAGALLLVAAYTALVAVRARIYPVNVALGKPVRASSRSPGTPDGQGLVDGDTGTSYAIATNTEDNPSVVVDLQAPYAVDQVRVHNRVDGWFDDGLPLVVELSLDGVHYDEIGRRDQHFDADPPWLVFAHGRMAQFVRVRVARRSYLALSEVEVYAKPNGR